MSAGPGAKLLLSVFSTFSVGGAQIRFAAVANHFGDRLRHVIVAMDDALDAMDLLKPGLNVRVLPVDQRKGDTLGNRRCFRKVLREIGPDLLATYNWGTIEWAMANWPRPTPHIHFEDGFGPEEANRQLPRRVLTRRLVLRGSTVVVPSRRLEAIARDIWKLPRIRFVPNGIDCARFSAPGIVPLVPRDGIPAIGTVAALRKEKNIPRLLEAFRRVRAQRPCRLIVAGDGSEKSALVSRAVELGLAGDVIFTGYRSDTERVYAILDVFALSSDTEQMPTSVLEAMAAGLPIVSPDVGDVRQMVAAENAPFITAPDAGALACAIAGLLDRDDLRAQIGAANGKAAAANFSEARMFAEFGRFFEIF